jgi:hypothetical protein
MSTPVSQARGGREGLQVILVIPSKLMDKSFNDNSGVF